MSKLFKLIALVLTIITLIIVPSKINAQSSHEQAYQSYINQLDLYRESRDEYLLRRGEYLRHRTLAAQREAENATRIYLIDRDEVWRLYLITIMERLNGIEGLEETEKNEIYSRLDEERNWYQDHKTRLQTANDLESMVLLSSEAQERSLATEELSYHALHAISKGKIVHSRNEVNSLINHLEDKVLEISAEGYKDTDIIKKWIGDAKNELAQSQGNQELAKNELEKMSERGTVSRKRNHFNSSQNYLNSAKLNVEEAAHFLQEIITEIKTADSNGK